MESAATSTAFATAGGAGWGVAALIAQREQELAQLRLDSIQALQQQVSRGKGCRRI